MWEVKTLAQRAAEALPDNVWGSVGYMVLGTLAIAALIAILGMVLIYVERKVAGHFQCRTGPMRVGWHGIFQTVADTLKLLLKEDVVPTRADKFLHLLAPFLSFWATILLFMILPFSPGTQMADINIGVLFVGAVSGFGVLGILLAGWSSNNKWALIGSMRAGAQIISYELSATLALLVVVLLSGSMKLSDIIRSQAEGWWIWRAHGVGLVGFVLFLIASVAEINRPPFDLPEGESELTAGFHTEYSGMRFAMFFLSEFVNMFVVSAMATTLFLGGWMPFHIGDLGGFNAAMDWIAPGIWFSGKTAILIFFIMWFRWTFPRLRVDQLMRLEWKILMPIGFVNLMATAIIVLFGLYFYPVR